MTALAVIGALVVPWAAGTGLIAMLHGDRPNRTLSIGAGWLAGQVMLMAMLYLALVFTGAGHAWLVLGLLACAAVVFGGLALRRPARRQGGLLRVRPNTLVAPPSRRCRHRRDACATGLKGRTLNRPRGLKPAARRTGPFRLPHLSATIFTLCAGAGILVKLTLAAGAHAWIPTRGDDAISIWLFKAKAVAVLNQLSLDETHDYYLGGSNPHYPIFPSLVAAWIPLVAGSWNEQLATLPWLFYGINLILLIAGGLQRWLSRFRAWTAAYLVASLPLLAVHVYRPGYADLLLASFLAGTVVFLLIWRTTNLARHWVLAILLALATACMKREGPALALIALACVVGPSWRNLIAWPARRRLAAGAVAAACGLIAWALLDFSEQAENAALLGYHAAVWAALWRHGFDWSSFHFLFWLAAAVLPIVAFRRDAPHRAPAVLLALGLFGFVSAVFLITPQAVFALNDQTPSRLMLQIAPSIVLALAVPVASVLDGERRDPVF